MLIKLVEYADLSPLLPTNETLSSMTNQEFADAMNKWTEAAKACERGSGKENTSCWGSLLDDRSMVTRDTARRS